MQMKLSLKKKLAFELFRQYKRNTVKLHELNYLFWECTLRCNLNCLHCGSDCRTSSSAKDMPTQDFIKVIDKIIPHINPNKTMIVFTGGEPLMRKDLEQCGKILSGYGFPWGLVSNGFLLNETRLETLLDAGMTSTTISLDGFEKAHNTLRRNNSSFEKAITAIQLLATIKDFRFDVVTCVSSLNFEELENFKNYLIDIGVKEWRIFTIFPIGRADQNAALQLNSNQFKTLFDFIAETRKENQIKLNYGCEGFLGNYESEVRDNFFFCRAGVNIASVLVDGSISACPSLRSNFIQGNIYKDDFMQVWNEKFIPHRNREWTKTGICADCSSYKYCEGNSLHLRNEKRELLFCHLRKMELADRK